MELTKEELLHLIEQYPIEVERVSNLGPSRYRIDGPFAVYEARVVPSRSGMMRAFISDYAAKRGFFRTQRFVVNLFHEQMVSIARHNVFYVTDWFSGTPLTFARNDCTQAANTIANLHIALEGSLLNWKRTMSEVDVPTSSDFMTEFRNHLQLLKTQWIRIKHLQSVPFANWLEEAVHRADWVIRSLSVLSRAIGKTASSLDIELRYGISELQQFIRFENGRIGVLQTDDPKSGGNILDLAYITREAFRHHDASIVEEMIEAYQALIPSSRLCANFIRTFCAFPQRLVEFVRCNQFECMDNEAIAKEVQEAELEARAARQLLQAVNQVK